MLAGGLLKNVLEVGSESGSKLLRGSGVGTIRVQ